MVLSLASYVNELVIHRLRPCPAAVAAASVARRGRRTTAREAQLIYVTVSY